MKQKTKSVWFNARKYYENTKTFDENLMYNQPEGCRKLTPDNIAAYADFTWIKAYTRESIQKYDLKWPVGLTFEDGEFYFKYFTYYPDTYVISDALINYRYRDDSIVRQADRGNVHMEHIYQVVKNLRDFWISIGVYERYKTTILKLIQNRIRMCYGLNYSDKNKYMSYEFLRDIKYPEDFQDFVHKEKNYNPLVSIIIPVYNVEKYIEQCITSILNQTYKNFEVLCIDDCGKDNSVNILEKYAEKDKRVKIIKHKENMGAEAARNTGLDNAKGEYILFADSDDYLKKDCIELSVNKIIETGLDIVMFKSDILWEDTQTITSFWHKYYADFPEGYFTLNENELCSLPHYSWNKIYKSSFLKKNEIKWYERGVYEDMEFFFRIFTLSPKTYMIDKSLYIYRRRDDSLVGDNYKNLTNANDLYVVTKRIKDFLTENNLMDRYYKSFMQLLCNNINNYRGWPRTHKELSPLMLKCLNDLNFPNDFQQYSER